MESKFKKAQTVTTAMIVSVLAMGLVAFLIAKPHGYGGSSEAKMNFLRLIVFGVSVIQIMMAGAVRGVFLSQAGGKRESQRFAGQMIVNALCEAPAIFGLALVFMTKSFLDFVICAGLSLLGFLVLFPRAHT